MILNEGMTICDRFSPPENYERVVEDRASFAHFLSNLPLKMHGAQVQYYNGSLKSNHNVYKAVVDLPIGNKDLHQCADAIMRLKAEYHWNQKMYDKIHFNFTNGQRVEYTEWMKGRRMRISGNKAEWVDRQGPSNTYQDFWEYMELIFMYAGTASLEKELSEVSMRKMEIGDVFIRGGFPGHAVMVVDMAINNKTGEQVYLLGQSYMPAQEFQILENPNDPDLSPWYRLKESEKLMTPEWTFYTDELKRFTD